MLCATQLSLVCQYTVMSTWVPALPEAWCEGIAWLLQLMTGECLSTARGSCNGGGPDDSWEDFRGFMAVTAEADIEIATASGEPIKSTLLNMVNQKGGQINTPQTS